MPTIHRSAIVPYSTEQMYELVNDIARYQEFVPYCIASVVQSQSDDEIRATLTLSAKGFQKSFSTLNRLQKNSMMEIQLIDGPFEQLEGFWKFEQRDEMHSEVILDLTFTLSHKLFAMMFGSVFQEVAGKLVDAFVTRAKEIY
ncbi:MAG: ubiquinone-binding protein [Gammaproteobacteria bacterium CG_4_10_14_0_8_um_filter_38_16]|nr:MAG: ubiquinone-binding protein [Gammaproteobacteria bacterium CG_4_10_14_0_8_um_filter_38_16]PJA04161.1 MAG: ubiquinone-binding protein [Gammaproteobacteria bacterium CG_4_10_14_0_2_um_filter_38_22]PJB10102.1 MAG: ubiquinone-binding protein [Gammaproteobacteria bacterium CG_4_9_14_3_um_filter_38_9]